MSFANLSFLKDLKLKRGLQTSVDDDAADRLSHMVTVTILVVFAAAITSVQYVGDPIHCWLPAEYKEDWHGAYVKNYCWVSNTYHVPMNDVIPVSSDVRREAQLGYYQWVPIILLVQALLFKLPNVLWHMTNRSSGVNLTRLCSMIDNIQTESKTDRAKNIHNISVYLHRWLQEHRHYHSNLMVTIKRKTSNVFLFCFGQREGLFLSGLYLFVKLLYLANCGLQFWLLGKLLSINFIQYGVDSVNCILGNCFRFQESRAFPRVTLCDYKIRLLQNVNTFTVQCVLPINLFNEKLFVFLWIWILITGIVTLLSVFSWLYFMTSRRGRKAFVGKFLTAEVESVTERRLVGVFADQYLRSDGCFLLKVVGKNTSDVTLSEVVTDMWKTFKDASEGQFKDACCNGDSN